MGDHLINLSLLHFEIGQEKGFAGPEMLVHNYAVL
jgi:hypothetical protein